MAKLGLGAQCLLLGYILQFRVTDDMGRYWLYKTSPSNSGGTTNYFKKREQLEKWIAQVRENRLAEARDGEILLLDFMEQ